MRHLHFTQSLEPLYGGGLGTSAIALHRQMRLQGLSSVLCSTFKRSPQYPGGNVHEFRRVPPDAAYFSPAMQRQACHFVGEADVIHGHGLYVGTNLILGRAARKQQKSMVYHVHGMFEPYILGRSKWKKRLVHWLFEDANFREVRLWRALTENEADQIRACGIRQPVVVTPNGVNIDDYAKPMDSAAPIETPMVPKLNKNRRRVLFLGRIHPKKGLNVLLAAWAKLSALTRDWQLAIAGPDEQGHLAKIQALARSLGLQNEVVFTGPVTGHSKVQLLYSSDLFILPSYSEGFSMSILEAMACERPVLATLACNFPELSASQAGWECEATAEALAASLKIALGTSDLERQQRGAIGRRMVETRYTWASVIDRLEKACATYC
jgi:glycosyltransferase involved in cell wall biosynthesis